MNELVKDLLKQSTYEILGVPQVDQKQFAELIISECISVCENQAGIQSTAYRCNLVEHDTSSTADACANMIKHHFGIEDERAT